MVLLALVLVLAAALRFWRLDDVPPGLTHDEAAHGQDAIAILHGARPLYETIGYGREPLYDYAVAIGMAVSGQTNYTVLRGVSVLFGLATVAATYFWVRRAFGPWEAILASGWLAGSFWALSASRQALRSVALPPLLTAAVYAWWRGTYDRGDRLPRRHLWYALSGLLVGATLWTYMAARATWSLFLALPIFLLATDRARLRQRWPGMLLTLGVGVVSAAPMFVWLHQNPGAEQRFSQLGEPLRLLTHGDIHQLWRNALEALGMFTQRADDLWIYNVPGRPWLGPVEGAAFYLGLAVACWRWRRPGHTLALMWLAVGALPSLITGVSASATRAIGILPVLHLFPALAVAAGLRWVRSRWAGARFALVPLVVAAIVAAGVRSCRDYFFSWSNARDVRVGYHTTLFEIGQYLDERAIPPGTVVVLSSIYPGRYHDPYALALTMARRDLSLRWVDGRGALVFPAPPSRLIVPAIASVDPLLGEAIAPPHARLVESHLLRTDDLNPAFDVYDWASAESLENVLAQTALQPAAWSPSERLPAGSPVDVYQRLDLPADLGHTIALLGYDLPSRVVAPGEDITLVTYWRVLSSPPADLDTVVFTHLLAPGKEPPVIAQQDRLDAPAWNWHPGDVIAQVHRLEIDNDVPAGRYPLEVGAFTRPLPSPVNPDPPTTRYRLYVEGRAVSDRILLPPLHVKEPAD
jgi:4-amino-4-deoxy-L-arabinose transferase-like glycosyltransferase